MLKQKLQNGANMYGTWQRIPSPTVSEILAISGIHFVAIDMEHAPIDISELRVMVPIYKMYNVPVILRVASAQSSFIAKALDLGIDGIMVPQIQTQHEVQTAVNRSKFAPVGRRGIGGPCASDGYGEIAAAEFMQKENERLLTIIQIETKEAIQNLNEIINIQGVDAFYIGPMDLSQVLGYPGEFFHPVLIQAIQTIIDTIRPTGIPIGMHSPNQEFTAYWQERGVQLFTMYTDQMFLKQGIRNMMHSLQSND